jgi:hypothetical protein
MTQTVDIRIVGGGQRSTAWALPMLSMTLKILIPTTRRLPYCQGTGHRESHQSAWSQYLVQRRGRTLYQRTFWQHAFGFNISDIPTGGGFVSTRSQ